MVEDSHLVKELEHLKESTQALALPYEEQVQVFPSFVLITDELVLEYDEAFRFIDEMVLKNLITKKDKVFFEKIDQYSQYLSDNFTDLFLNEDSLKTDLKWEKMRELAKQALKNMNWEICRPTFSNNTYVGKK